MPKPEPGGMSSGWNTLFHISHCYSTVELSDLIFKLLQLCKTNSSPSFICNVIVNVSDGLGCLTTESEFSEVVFHAAVFLGTYEKAVVHLSVVLHACENCHNHY